MNITSFVSSGNVYLNCESIKGYAFRKTSLWGKCALLPVICADFELRQDKCAHLRLIERLLPHDCSA